MAQGPEDSDTLCPVSRSTALIGDRWSLLVIRELFMGGSRFLDLQVQTGATPQMLTARLKRLEADGLVRKRPSAGEARRHEYALTEKGADLLPVLLALRGWGEKWCKSPEEGVALRTTHRTCGAEVGIDGVCPACNRPVAWPELAAAPTADYLDERRRRTGARNRA